MIPQLNQGKWSRPTDKSAVYTEIGPGCSWGIRVTLIADFAKVEVIKGARDSLYKPPKRYAAVVRPPNIWERLRGITFTDKVLATVQEKRRIAEEENINEAKRE